MVHSIYELTILAGKFLLMESALSQSQWEKQICANFILMYVATWAQSFVKLQADPMVLTE